MTTRTLRLRSAIPLTALGFGGAPLGNLYAPVSETAAQATLDAAWAAGLRMFDTAPLYGFGLSEDRFGRSLATRRRDEFILSTKVGRLLRDCAPGEVPQVGFHDTPQRTFDYDYSYDGVLQSYEASLKRLGVDRVDILLVHDVDVFTHGSKPAAEVRIRELFDRGGYRALVELRAAGAVSAIGAGVNEWEVCERLAGLGDFDCFLLAGRYTLLEQEALTSFLPLCAQRDIGVILGGPFNSGILATGPTADARYNYAPAPAEILARVEQLDRVCRTHGVSLAAVALQFVLAHPAVKTVIPGANSPEQVHAIVRLLASPIPLSLWSDMKMRGLIREDAPVPSAIRPDEPA